MSSSEDESDSVRSELYSTSEESASDDESTNVPFVPQYIIETIQHIDVHGAQIGQKINSICEDLKTEEESDGEIDGTKGLADQVEKLSRKLANVQIKLHTERRKSNKTAPVDENSGRDANGTGKYAGMDSGQVALLERLTALEQRFTSLTGQATNYAAELNSVDAETEGL